MAAQGGNIAGPAPADPSDESLCRRCGRCCCRKFIIGGQVYFTPFFCEFLDPETRLCTVYAHRRQMNPVCVPPEKGLARGVFPADCPYVAGHRGYRPPVEDLDFFGLGEFAREVARELGVGDEEFERVRREHLERKGTENVCAARA